MNNPVIDNCGNQFWYNSDGDFHREDGPAVIYSSGKQEWWVYGILHRINGPAIIYSSGSQHWFVDGYRCRDNKSFQVAAKLTDEDMLMITLKYGDVKPPSLKSSSKP